MRPIPQLTPAMLQKILDDQGLVIIPKSAIDAQVAYGKQIGNWEAKYSGLGIIGDVSVGGQSLVEIGDKTIENTTPIPKDMFEHMAAIFTERDRLVKEYLPEVEAQAGEIGTAFAEHMKKYPDAEKWPTLHGMLMPKAIENVRKRIAQEA